LEILLDAEGNEPSTYVLEVPELDFHRKACVRVGVGVGVEVEDHREKRLRVQVNVHGAEAQNQGCDIRRLARQQARHLQMEQRPALARVGAKIRNGCLRVGGDGFKRERREEPTRVRPAIVGGRGVGRAVRPAPGPGRPVANLLARAAVQVELDQALLIAARGERGGPLSWSEPAT